MKAPGVHPLIRLGIVSAFVVVCVHATPARAQNEYTESALAFAQWRGAAVPMAVPQGRRSKRERLRAAMQLAPVSSLPFTTVLCSGDFPNAVCSIEIAPGSFLMARRYNIAIAADQNGLELSNEVLLPTPVGNVPLAEAHLVLERGPSPYGGITGGFQTVRGSCRLPFPGVGLLRQIGGEMDKQPLVQLGIDFGRNLIKEDMNDPCFAAGECLCVDFCLDAPVPHPDRLYWFFQFVAGYEAKLGPFTASSPSAEGLLVLDPTDPFFYLSGGINGFEKKDDSGSSGNNSGSSGVADFNGGFGFSWHGDIPFKPSSTYGVGDQLPPFTGNFIINTSVPLPPFPLKFTGIRVFDLDPDNNGSNPFIAPGAFARNPDVQYGGNGTLDVEIPFLKFFSFGFELGTSTVFVRISPEKSEAYFSGTLDPENPLGFLPDNLPIPIRQKLKVQVAGLVSNTPENWFVRSQGEFVIDTSGLAKLLGQPLSAVDATDGLLSIDKNGFRLQASTASQLHPDVEQDQSMGVEVSIPAEGGEPYLALLGGLTIDGEGLQNGELKLSPTALTVTGNLSFQHSVFQMEGDFRASGPFLQGTATVAIPYDREDTTRKLQLLAQIATQQNVVDTANTTLMNAQTDLTSATNAFNDAQAAVNAAQAQVDMLQSQIDAIDQTIAQLQSDLDAQNNRTCSKSYSGCPSCSCSSRCDCGTFDVACKADCALCEAGLAACEVTREACADANVAACVADRTKQIADLGVQIGAKQTARGALVASKTVADSTLTAAQNALQIADGPFETAKAAVEAAQTGYDAAVQGLTLLQQQLDNLPDIQGTVMAKVTITIDGNEVSGDLTADFQGMPVLNGRVNLNSQPQVACFTIPVPELQQEFCAPL
jgi:hypothetical protein